MELEVFIAKAKEVRDLYAAQNKKAWGAPEYAQGFVGDVGDLAKLVLAKEGYRTIEDVDAKLAHELADCLWSVLVLADEFGVDLEKEFFSNMDALNIKITNQHT